MKSTAIVGLVLSFAGVTIACSQTETGPNPDPQVAVPPEPPATKSPVQEPTEPPPVAKPECNAAVTAPPTCGATKAAPVSQAAISTFVKDTAVPIRCGTNDNNTWNVAPLIDLYGDNKIFMVGEVHGTNEIGIVSSLIFEELVKKNLVNVVAFEMPMDFESSYQRYVDTGHDAMVEQYMTYLAPNFFGTILPKTARDLVATKGAKLKVGTLDIPMNPSTAVSAIQEVAAKLTTQQSTVLTTLPTTLGGGSGGGGQFTAEEIATVNTYFDHIMANKTAICTELTAADCDRLNAMTHALWASTLTYDDTDAELWFARREEVIYYNMKTKIAGAGDRMFLHMGAQHTNKHTFSAGSRMTKEYTLTKGLVFSVAPAWDQGSKIWYQQTMDLPPEPESITNALSSDAHPAFVSVTRPTKNCEANPIGVEHDVRIGHNNDGTRAELYDGYIHYGRLTSEREPELATLKRDTTATGSEGKGASFLDAKLVAFRSRIEKNERAAFDARAARLRGQVTVKVKAPTTIDVSGFESRQPSPTMP